MASSPAPSGLRPVNMQGGQVMTHGIRLLPITAAYATSIFFGDPVKIVAATGTCEKETGTTGLKPVGVFLGCEYQDTAMGLFHRQFWPASTVVKTNTTAWAYVIDDPDALFEIQASGSVTQNKLGLNANIINPAAVASQLITGNSKVSLDITGIANTATFPLRIVDFVRRPGSVVGDAFTDCIVRFNTHLNRDTTGAV
jgi:hypothetical protein